MRFRGGLVLAVAAVAITAGAGPAVTANVPVASSIAVSQPDGADSLPLNGNITGTDTPPAPSSGSAIGALFTVDGSGLGDHFCSASVVHSQDRDLVITAAHCIHDGADGDYHTNVAFVPGYHDGVAPFGVWLPTRLYVDARWVQSSDPDLDVGFLVVEQPGNARPIEDVVGGNELATDRGFPLPVRITGYPQDTDAPVFCQTTTARQDTYQSRMDCPGFPDGTSGGPWVVPSADPDQEGSIVGVIGGYQEGGDDPDTSYSSYFDADIAALYRTATSGAAGDVVRPPDPAS